MPLTRADEIELEADAAMALTAERMGKDKCVKVGCMVLINPKKNRDGYCSFCRPRDDRKS